MNDFKNRPVEVITSRVEPELALFQVKIEGGHAMVIVDTKHDNRGNLSELKVAESNYGGGG